MMVNLEVKLGEEYKKFRRNKMLEDKICCLLFEGEGCF